MSELKTIDLKAKLDRSVLLSEAEKAAFFEWFVKFKFKKGHAIYNLFKISKRLYDKKLQEAVYKELAELGILAEKRYIVCPTCREKEMSHALSLEEVEQVEAYLTRKEIPNRATNEIEDLVDHLECENCGYTTITQANLLYLTIFAYNI